VSNCCERPNKATKRSVRRHLEESGRLSYRVLRREFALDDDTLAERH
jgi:hypothetical protein